jgi:uncharacterized membrane protein
MAAGLLFAVVDLVSHYNLLPPRMASHFDLQGNANGWSTKGQFIGFMAIMLMVVSMAPVSIVSAALFMPASVINMSHKEYWFAPEREAESRRALAEWGLWFGGATLWYMVLVLHDALKANLRQPPRLEFIWWMLAGYLAIVGYLIYRMIMRFGRPPAEAVKQG